MADQNFRVKRGLEVGVGKTILYADPGGDVGINSTAPTATLDVNGTLNVSGASTFQDNVNLGDNDRLRLGDSNDLEIYHDSSNSYITDSGSGNLLIGSDNDLWITNAAGTENKARFTTNGGVNLYYNNSKKFETTGAGVTVFGTTESQQLVVSGVSTFQDNVNLGDDDRLRFGDGNDLQIFHDGTDDLIFSSGSTLKIAGSRVVINNAANNESQAIFTEDGASELYYDNSKKFETTTTGIAITNGASTSATIAGPDEIIIDPATVGDNTGSVRIKGDLFVDGTQTIINSSTIELADFIVGIASTATTDSLADGAGIQIGPDNTFLYEYNGGTNPSLKSSENLNVASGKHYQIGETEVLNATTLGSGVVNSSLTSVGTLTGLTVSGDVSIADKIVHTGDTNTAIRFPAADTFTVETAGSERLRVASDGNIGIGENNPAHLLHLKSTGDARILIQADSDNSGENDNARISFSQDGAVAIDDFEIGLEGDAGATMTNTLANAAIISANNAVNQPLQLGHMGNTIMTLRSDNVGIGTNNPTSVLDVKTSLGRIRFTSSGSLGSRIQFTDADGTVRGEIQNNGGSNELMQILSPQEIRFTTSSTERLRITNTGNVGINTIAPSQTLDVNGNARFRGAIYDSGNGAGTSGQILSSTATGVDWIDQSSLSVGNADTLDNLDSTQFLRSDASGTTTGDITISKTSPKLILSDTNTTTGSYPAIQFDTNNNQGVLLEHNEFNGELPTSPSDGYGLILKESPNNGQFPGTGTLTFTVLGEIYTGSATTASTSRVLTTADEGPGNGLDADTLDGTEGANFLRSDVADTASGVITFTDSIVPSVGNNTSSGINWPANPGGGSGDQASIRYYITSGENTTLEISNNNDAQDIINLVAGSVNVGGNRILTTADEGSGNGLDADTLDGLHSTSFLRSDATDVKTAGSLRFDDNIELRFGSTGDLLIYHNGSNSFIEQVGTGNLILKNDTDDTDVIIRTDDGSGGTTPYFIAEGSTGEVQLYHYGSLKVNTNASGAVVSSNADTILRVTSPNGSGAFLDLGDTSDPDGGRIVYDSGSNLALYTASTERMRIDSSGNIGIGTDSPTALLNVYGTTSPYILVEDGSPIDNQARINFKSPSYEWTTGVHGGDSGKYKISYASAHGTNDYLTITTSGSVGIGTDAPTQGVDINRGIRIRKSLYDVNNQAGTSGQVLSSTGSGVDWIDQSSLSVDTATTSTNVTVADESTDTTCFPLFVTDATGDLPPKSGSNLTFNSNTGVLGATTFESTQATGTAPFTVASTTVVSNLNSDLLDGQQGSYYTDASNINAGTINDAYLPASISSDITGNAATATTATDATNVTVADESTDTTCFPLFVTDATGNLPPKSGTNLKFNSNTGILDATQFKSTFNTGTGGAGTSLTEGAIVLNHTAGAIVIDDAGQRRISWNDGGGNFQIRSGHYYNSGEKYVVTGDGAANIQMNTDAQNAEMRFEVANTGTAGNVVGWGKTVELTPASFNVDGNEVLDAATSFSGDVTGTYNSISVTNDSHTHDTRYFTETESDARFLRKDTADTASGLITFDAGLTIGVGQTITHNNSSSRDKIRVWNSNLYTIGMDNAFTFGALNNNFAMTFQMDNNSGRGWWWGDDAHTDAQGAMSLNTQGKLSVAHSLRLGYGESDTTVPGATYRLDVNGDVNATSYYGDGSNLTGVQGGKWVDAGVGIVTTSSIGVNTTTVVGTANSEGAIQAVGNIALIDGAILTDQNIDNDIYIPSGKNGLLIGPSTVGVGVTIDIAPGSTLVVV